MATKQQIPVIAAALVTFQEEFTALSNEDGQFVIQNTKEAIKLFVAAVKNRAAEAIAMAKNILRLISGGEKLMIESLDGKATIANAKGTFPSGIDSDFKNWKLNNAGQATGEVLMDVHEMTGDGTFVQIFSAITPDLEKIVMSQHQVIRFCEKYPTWLRQDGYGTFFLIKENGEYFVVNVRVLSDGLNANVNRLADDNVWHGEFRHRVVAPQLMPSVA